MAILETRTFPTGTSYRVTWRQDGLWQSETFGADRRSPALRFRRDVEQAGNRWPDGWLKGIGCRQELDVPVVPDQPLLRSTRCSSRERRSEPRVDRQLAPPAVPGTAARRR